MMWMKKMEAKKTSREKNVLMGCTTATVASGANIHSNVATLFLPMIRFHITVVPRFTPNATANGYIVGLVSKMKYTK